MKKAILHTKKQKTTFEEITGAADSKQPIAVNVDIATLVSFNPADVSTLTIKNKAGKIEKLYWMEYFENADYFRTNMGKFMGKKVSYGYEEKEIYNAATKTYKSIKVITSIELN